MQPDTIQEKGYVITGTVRTVFTKSPVENAHVSILSFSDYFAEETITNSNGRFYLNAGSAADSTGLMVQTTQRLNGRDLEIMLDHASFPERVVPVIASGASDREVFAKYVNNAEQQFVEESGARINYISEVTITASRKKVVDYSFFYLPRDVNYCLTEEEIKNLPIITARYILGRIPGVYVSGVGDSTKVMSGSKPVFIFVDDRQESAEFVTMLHPNEIVQVELLNGYALSVLTHGKANPSRDYGIAIHTTNNPKFKFKKPYIKYVNVPLGIQRPAVFYAPKYDSPAQNTKPDLRTTIHWQPSITTDENGTTSFIFYTADAPATYTVVIEGITEDGKIIYKKDKIVVE